MYRVLSIAKRIIPLRVRNIINKLAPAALQKHLNRLPNHPGFLEHQLRARLGDKVTFVQIGSHDGEDDLVRQLAMERPEWRGLLIEPLPHLFSRLQTNYSDPRFTLANMAVAAQAGILPFYYVPDSVDTKLDLPCWFDQIASLNKGHLIKLLGPEIEPHILEIPVPCNTVSGILQTYNFVPSEVDYLQIDTEGYDFEVLKMVDFTQMKPRLILFEHAHLSPDDKNAAWELLTKHGYLPVEHAGDTLAILQ